MEDASSKLNELARMARSAQNYLSTQVQLEKTAKESIKITKNWRNTEDGKKSLAAMENLISSIKTSMSLSFELLGKTEDMNNLSQRLLVKQARK